MFNLRELKSWGSSTEVVESLVNDLDCVSRKVLYPELLVFSYAVFNNQEINISVRKYFILIFYCIILFYMNVSDTILVANANVIDFSIITKRIIK